MEMRTPFFLTNLLRRSPKKSNEEKGWENTTDDISFNGWGSSTSSGPITNGWADEPPQTHYNGWGSGSGPSHRPSITTNGWAHEKPKDEYNGWTSGLDSDGKCTPLEARSTNGWTTDEPPNKDEHNGWSSFTKRTTPKATSTITIPESEAISNQSRLGNIESWAPSAPPLPNEGFNEDLEANVSDQNSYFEHVDNDKDLMNKSNNGDALCVICWEAGVEGACVPCGHMASCMTCLHEIESKQGTCPVCRAKIDKVIRIYALSTK